MSALTALASGLLFAIGLALAGMVQPATVQGFLDFLGTWNPSLALVMGAALAVHAVASRFILRRAQPVWGDRFHLPTALQIDARLLLGAVLFGAGWGLAGVCPGPSLVAVASLRTEPLIFAAAMVGGMALFRAFERLRARATA